MAVTFYPFGEGDYDLILDVPDPGCGRIVVSRDDGSDDWTLTGTQIGATLRALINRATLTGVGDVTGLGLLTVEQQRQALPAFVEAVVYAAAGTDRAQRLLDDADPAWPPLCSSCGDGSSGTYDSAQGALAWCAGHGHSRYGSLAPWPVPATAR